MKLELAIKLTGKLIKCRDTAKNFFGSQYAEKIKPYKRILQQVMKSNNIDEVESLIKISQTNTYKDSATAQLMFMAATLDTMEENGTTKVQ